MPVELHILNAAGKLASYRSRLSDAFDATVGRVQSLLPVRDVDVVMQALTAWAMPETGISGYSPAADLAFIYLDPANGHFDASLATEVPAMLAHELFHCARWGGPGYGSNLADALVSEGLALHFEAAFRDAPPFYATGVEPEQLDELLRRARPELQSTDYNHVEWFYGSPSSVMRRHAGYALAFYIVGGALQRLGRDPGEVWDQQTAEIMAAFELAD